MLNIAVAQSGGPTSAINATLAGVIRACHESQEIRHIYGYLNGIEGVIHLQAISLSPIAESEDSLLALTQTPSAYLGSCRYKLPDFEKDDTVYRKIIENLKALNIDAFLYIGGNDSMDTVEKLHRYCEKINCPIRMIGIPKTIDNDLPGTDHTPGFGSAAKYVATSIMEIIRDSYTYSVNSVAIVEVMGRNAGWLTAASALGRVNGEIAPHLIYLPEAEFSVQKFLSDTREAMYRHKAVVIAISEGVTLDDSIGEYQSNKTDAFSHRYLSGVGKAMEHFVASEIGCKVRSIELNVPQRCAAHLASKTDLMESIAIGRAAVEKACNGQSGIMLSFIRVSNNPYEIKIEETNVAKAANQEKKVPRSWINETGNDVLKPMIDYLYPLIQGEWPVQMKNGLPMHLVRKI